MSVVNSTPLLLGDDGYQISRSVRLRSSASAYLNRTLTTGSSQKWTWSGWVKRGNITVDQTLFSRFIDTNTTGGISFVGAGALQLLAFSGGSAVLNLITTQVFRDPSAHYYLTVSLDTTQATASNRAKIWVNGVQVTSLTTATYPAQNSTGVLLNGAGVHKIGMQDYPGYPNYFDGYLTEINFIDGQALTPSSFGEFDAITGVWKPKKYAGTYGTNGFYLNFSDNSAATAAAIGKDYSGNGNNWTPNNISVTAGVTYDSMLDVPTQWADGGNGRGNYAVLNPLDKTTAYTVTVTGGNLQANVGGVAGILKATFGVSSGKWYWEFMPLSSAGSVGVVGITRSDTLTDWRTPTGFGYEYTGNKATNGTKTAYGAAYTGGDVLGVALDMDAGTLAFYKNGVSQGTAFTGLTGAAYSPSIQHNGAVAGSWDCYANFGQRPFAYTPPTGFKALNTQNLPESTIKKGNQYFDATLYTGNGSSQTIVNAGGFKPDLVWQKSRSNTENHALFDAVRGGGVILIPNLTNAEAAGNSGTSDFNSNGFTTGSAYNTNGYTYVGWQWKEGASAGFDIVTYTGTGANRTVAHSLGVQPKMVIIKQRNGVTNWAVNHVGIWSTGQGVMYLNLTNANSNDATFWNSTNPTTTDIYLGTNGSVNGNGNTYVAYCFTEVAGYSKFGSYTGNGSADGPFVYLGFRPRFVMFKRTDAVEGWYMYDTARDTINAMKNELRAESSAAEAVFSSRDFLSNGFKVRTANGSVNASGGTYIFMAFAENPFKYSLAR